MNPMCAARAMFLTDGNSLMKQFVFCLKKPVRLTAWGLSADKTNAGGR